jgi:hypothetical protein
MKYTTSPEPVLVKTRIRILVGAPKRKIALLLMRVLFFEKGGVFFFRQSIPSDEIFLRYSLHELYQKFFPVDLIVRFKSRSSLNCSQKSKGFVLVEKIVHEQNYTEYL